MAGVPRREQNGELPVCRSGQGILEDEANPASTAPPAPAHVSVTSTRFRRVFRRFARAEDRRHVSGCVLTWHYSKLYRAVNPTHQLRGNAGSK